NREEGKGPRVNGEAVRKRHHFLVLIFAQCRVGSDSASTNRTGLSAPHEMCSSSVSGSRQEYRIGTRKPPSGSGRVGPAVPDRNLCPRVWRGDRRPEPKAPTLPPLLLRKPTAPPGGALVLGAPGIAGELFENLRPSTRLAPALARSDSGPRRGSHDRAPPVP